MCDILKFDVIKPHLGFMVSSLLIQLDAQKVFINIKLHTNIIYVVYSFTDIPSKMYLSIMIEMHFLVLAPKNLSKCFKFLLLVDVSHIRSFF